MNTTGGSGYDIACAGSMGPILFQKRVTGPSWKQIDFFPYFHENLYFVYQGKKVSTASEVEIYQNLDIKNKTKIVNELSHITNELVQCHDIKEFDSLILAHENIISNALDKPRVLDEKFSDYWGAVKSLGAWGGDFILVSSQRSQKETAAYFASKGLKYVYFI
jgi:mevalonate kinase